MPKLKLTKASIDRIPNCDGQSIYWDTRTHGFGLLVGSKRKSFVAQGTVAGSTSRRRVTLGDAADISLEDARAKAEEEIRKMKSGNDPGNAKTTLRAVLDSYLKLKASSGKLRERTVNDYRKMIERYLPEYLDRPIRTFSTPALVEQIRNDITKKVQGGNNSNRSAGSATANYTMRILRALFNHARKKMRVPGIADNPVADIEMLPDRVRERALSDAELPAFYDAVCKLDHAVHRDYLLFLLYTGFRRSEAAGLKWSEVDFKEKVVTLPADRSKNRKDFNLPMSDLVHDLLVKRRSTGRDSSDYVFPANSASGHISEPRFALDRTVQAAGIESGLTLHDLRRTFVNIADASDISQYSLKALINHLPSRADVTNYNYANSLRTNPDRLRPAAQKVADRIKSLCGIELVEDEKVAKLA